MTMDMSVSDIISYDDECVKVGSDAEIVAARRVGRKMAEQLGFSSSDATLIATAISELARNIVNYAGEGEIVLRKVNGGNKNNDTMSINQVGIVLIAQDRGPGIHDIQLALRDGFSTSGSLGLGLSGVKNIMDEFNVDSFPGDGTIVTAIKWKRP